MPRISFIVLYKAVRSINAWYPLGALGIFLIAFFLAMALMFVFPQGTILLLFLGLVGLGIAVLGGKLLSFVQHSLAKHSLRRGVCPLCGLKLQQAEEEPGELQCRRCRVSLSQAGVETEIQAASRADGVPLSEPSLRLPREQ